MKSTRDFKDIITRKEFEQKLAQFYIKLKEEDVNELYAKVVGKNLSAQDFYEILSGAVKKGKWFNGDEEYLTNNGGYNGGYLVPELKTLINGYLSDANIYAFKMIEAISKQFKRSLPKEVQSQAETTKLITMCADAVKRTVNEIDSEISVLSTDALNLLKKYADIYSTICQYTSPTRNSVGEGEYKTTASHIVGDKYVTKCESVIKKFKEVQIVQLKAFLDTLTSEKRQAEERFTKEEVSDYLESSASVLSYLTVNKLRTIEKLYGGYLKHVTDLATSDEDKEAIKSVKTKDFLLATRTLFNSSNECLKESFGFLSGKKISEIVSFDGKDEKTMANIAYSANKGNTTDEHKSSQIKKYRLVTYFPDVKLQEESFAGHFNDIINGRKSLFSTVTATNIYDVLESFTDNLYALYEGADDKAGLYEKKLFLKQKGVDVEGLITSSNVIDMFNGYNLEVLHNKTPNGKKQNANFKKNLQYLNQLIEPKYILEIAKYNVNLLQVPNEQLVQEIEQLRTESKSAEEFNDALIEYLNSRKRNVEHVIRYSDKQVKLRNGKRGKKKDDAGKFGDEQKDNKIVVILRALEEKSDNKNSVEVVEEEIINSFSSIISDMTNHVVSLDEIKNIYNRLFAINKLLKGLKDGESPKENFAQTVYCYVDNLKDLVKKAKVSEDNYLQELKQETYSSDIYEHNTKSKYKGQKALPSYYDDAIKALKADPVLKKYHKEIIEQLIQKDIKSKQELEEYIRTIKAWRNGRKNSEDEALNEPSVVEDYNSVENDGYYNETEDTMEKIRRLSTLEKSLSSIENWLESIQIQH